MKSHKKILILVVSLFLFFCFGKIETNAQIAKLEDLMGDASTEQLISMDLQDANLKDVMKIFSIQSGLNFIASEEVENRKISLFLDKVPIKEAMEKLFKANKLTYEWDENSNIYVVKYWGKPEIERITRIYILKYRTVSSAKMMKEKDKLFTSSYSVSSSSGDSSSSTSSGTAMTTGTETETVNNNDIISAVRQVLTKDGKCMEESATNSIIVTDSAINFPTIEHIIARLDMPQPLVMLEVEMLDVDKNKIDKLGFQFNGNSNTYSFDLKTATKVTAFPFSAFNADNIGNMPSLFSSDKGYGTATFGSWDIALNLLKQQRDTKFLARPRLLTLNNEPAEISITRDEVVTVKKTYLATDSAGASTDNSVQIEFERATSLSLTPEGIGIFLKVTPQVNMETGEVTMVVSPKTSSTSKSPYIDIPDTLALDPEVRSTKSVVKVMDGETVVIGGLIHQEKDLTKTKMPMLGQIPIIGALFRSKDLTKDRERELLVFITPRIIKDPNMMKIYQEKKKLTMKTNNTVSMDSTKRNLIDASLNNIDFR